MDWRNTTLSPTRHTSPKVHIRYPCPGLFRFAGLLCFLSVGLGLYYGGIKLLSLQPLDWTAPAWTAMHVILVLAGVLLGGLAALLGAAYTMTIEVRNEHLSDLFIILWQFLAIGGMLWVFSIGTAMRVSLGKEGARLAVLHFGAELATWHAFGTGCIVGLVLGSAFFLAQQIRLPLIIYIAFSACVSLAAARWHFYIYGIYGKSWALLGVGFPLLVLRLIPPMIERDRRLRRVMMEQEQFQ